MIVSYRCSPISRDLLQVAAAREVARKEALNGADPNLNAADIEVALPEARIIPRQAPQHLPPGLAAMYEQFRAGRAGLYPGYIAPLLPARPLGPELPEARAARLRQALAQADLLRDQLDRLREARNGDNRVQPLVQRRRAGAPGVDLMPDREEMLRLLQRDLQDRVVPRPGDGRQGIALNAPLAPAAPALPLPVAPDAIEIDRQQGVQNRAVRNQDRAVRFQVVDAAHQELPPVVERAIAAGPNARRPAHNAAPRQQPARVMRFQEPQPARAVRFQDAPIAPQVAPNVAAQNDYEAMRHALDRLRDLGREDDVHQPRNPLAQVVERVGAAGAANASVDPVVRVVNRGGANAIQHFVSSLRC